MTIDPDSFRATLGRFASGVTVVTTRSDDGRDHGMTVSAFCSLSLEPPLVLVCVARDASLHSLLQPGRALAVNILAAGQEALSRRFSGPDPNRFDGIGFTRGRTGAAILDDTLAYLDCHVERLADGGDHTICICRVESATVRPDRPLLYYRGGYAQLER
ncbi:MAG TPA: flavin reductase family protein [Gemmatimonadales bacterium]